MPRQLNQQQRAFAEAYSKTGNATSAAISAGYAEGSAAQMGYKLLKNKLVVAECGRLRARVEKKAEISAARVLEELGKLAFGNMADLFDPETGELLPIHKLPRDVAATLTAFENEKGFQKVKTGSKIAALDTLTKIMGMIKQQDTFAPVQIIIGEAPRQLEQPADRQPILPVWE
jgi:phage terminase small subunit